MYTQACDGLKARLEKPDRTGPAGPDKPDRTDQPDQQSRTGLDKSRTSRICPSLKNQGTSIRGFFKHTEQEKPDRPVKTGQTGKARHV